MRGQDRTPGSEGEGGWGPGLLGLGEGGLGTPLLSLRREEAEGWYVGSESGGGWGPGLLGLGN